MKRYALLGLGAAGYAYFKKKENRDKAMVAFENTKTKLNSFIDQAKQSLAENNKESQIEPYKAEENKMIDEGAQTAVQYFNEEQEKNSESKA
ncbi:hypothetical protein [Jeotgalibacillus soli]|uniref:Uncharacterized protein n=1 Tax=Jeotgalibacillus soli TaxID=889306 RepID=A0A0C2VLK3_9BACL|nr:hypothetical protein [Jeotgalibacillus soli]KIL45346.1 hypothetical protein KP78_28900 [Jeotgalibacillus soli]